MLDKAKFDSAVAAVLARWEQLLQTMQPTYQNWLTVLTSSNAEETYLWSELLVGMREWFGERVLGQIKVMDWTVKNRDFEGSFTELVKNIERDKLGMLLPKTDNLFAAALTHPELLAYEMMLLGYSKPCFDGQLFLDANHPTPDGSGTFSNLTTAALSYNALWDGLQHFSLLWGANNQPLQLEPYLLWVGPGQQKIAAELLKMERNAAGATNTLRDALAIKINPYFRDSYAGYWQIWARPRVGGLEPVAPLAAAGSGPPPVLTPVSPFVIQMEKVPELSCTAASGQSLFGMAFQDLLRFMQGRVAFGVDYRGNATFSLPQLVYGSTGTNV